MLVNQNYTCLVNLRSETEIATRISGAESGIAAESRHKSATSQTGSAAFVEYLFLRHYASVRDRSVAHLSASSSLQLSLTVPAVERAAERESCPDQLGGCLCAVVGVLCSVTADGVVKLLLTDNLHPEAWITPFGNNNSWIINTYSLILDYTESEKIAHLDYNHEDFVPFGYLPRGNQQLIPCAVTVHKCGSDHTNPSSGSFCSAKLHQDMAECDDDPRSISKITRTPGRNISKLKRFFDSREHVSVDSSYNRSERSETSCSLTQTQEVFKMETEKLDCASNIGNSTGDQVLTHSDQTISNFSSSSSIVSSTCKNEKTEKESFIDESSLLSATNVPYCRKAPHGDLWKNVDIGVTCSDGLWNVSQSHDFVSVSSHVDQDDSRQLSNSFVSSTAELNDLIAVSRAELSKKKEPLVSDKSTLENYFTTAFETNKPKKFVPLNNEILSENSSEYRNCTNNIFHSSLTFPLDCEGEDMTFDDEDAALSDSSSEEELRCHQSTANTHYLPAYALHTIIEESCEESERDSRGATPTNDTVTSKLERYFSWDIINDSERDLKKKEDDESTIYSDSLSEGSGSVDDSSKDIDPSQLASSRLEKYFTSGLVGNENYFYPDDAEFLDDAPVSDFEEDSIHQKISRSALLNSLETNPVTNSIKNISSEHKEILESQFSILSNVEECDETVENIDVIDCCDNPRKGVEDSAINNSDICSSNFEQCYIRTENQKEESSCQSFCNQNEESSCQNSAFAENDEHSAIFTKNSTEQSIHEPATEIPTSLKSVNNLESNLSNENPPESLSSEVSNLDKGTSAQNQVVNKEQLALDAQAIIKKLLVYFTDSASKSFRENMETDYSSAWHILETEIERLMQSISPTLSLENNSCNSSTIDSNNSDYGSDTIESIDCITDEDDNTDSKSRINTKYPNFLNSAYKVQPEYDLHTFNISDETVSIWKRLIQSLQKDSSFMSENKIFDPSTEARLYIRDQIVMLMHTITVNESSSLREQANDILISNESEVDSATLGEKKDICSGINEAYNVNVSDPRMLTQLSEDDAVEEMVKNTKAESSDEGISVDSTENLHSTTEKSNLSHENAINNKLPPTDVSDNVQIRNEDMHGNDNSLCKATQDHENLPSENLLPYLTESPLLSSKEKIHVDEIDLRQKSINKISGSKDKDLNFSVFVDIELSEGQSTITERKLSVENLQRSDEEQSNENNQIASSHVMASEEILSDSISVENDHGAVSSSRYNTSGSSPSAEESSDILPCALKENSDHNMSCRDTGYYSFKSSEDSLLTSAAPTDDSFEVPNFKSLKRSVKKFPVSNTLSKSTNNIHQAFSVPDTKFCTLQTKTQKSKVSMNPNSSPSRHFTSLFSPSAVFKRLTGSKGNNVQTPESTIPAKYLKKYARSCSSDNESMFGAISMPHLNSIKPGDSYSAIGLYSENDRDSNITLDDESDIKPYSYSQSVLSLGSHSASMTSVYSAAGCHYGYVTVSGDVLFGLNYNQKSQMMEVFVKQCRNLAAVDIRRNKSDPYVKVYLLPDKTKSGKRKTKTKKSTLNPVFNELLRFPVLKHELDSRTLWLSVWNSDLFGRNDFLGEITLPLGYRLLDSPTLRWYPLQERMESLTNPLNYRGELFLALKYVPRDLSLETRFRPAPVISLRGALHVLVKEARNISTSRNSGVLDAFCKSYLLPDKSKSSKQKTPVVKKSRHPKWYYTVIYEDLSIDELKERSLELTVWDHDKLTSNEFMGGVRLNTGTGLYHGVSVEWMDARRDEAALWQAMLQSPNMWVDGSLLLRPTMQFHHS